MGELEARSPTARSRDGRRSEGVVDEGADLVGALDEPVERRAVDKRGDADRARRRPGRGEEKWEGETYDAVVELFAVERVATLARRLKLGMQSGGLGDRRGGPLHDRAVAVDVLVDGRPVGQQVGKGGLADAGGMSGVAPADARRDAHAGSNWLHLAEIDDVRRGGLGEVGRLPKARRERTQQRVDESHVVVPLVVLERDPDEFEPEVVVAVAVLRHESGRTECCEHAMRTRLGYAELARQLVEADGTRPLGELLERDQGTLDPPAPSVRVRVCGVGAAGDLLTQRASRALVGPLFNLTTEGRDEHHEDAVDWRWRRRSWRAPALVVAEPERQPSVAQ